MSTFEAWIRLAAPFLLTLLLTLWSPMNSGDSWFRTRVETEIESLGGKDPSEWSPDFLVLAKDRAEPGATCTRGLLTLVGLFLLIPTGWGGILPAVALFFGGIVTIVAASRMDPGHRYKVTDETGRTTTRTLLGQELSQSKVIGIGLVVVGLAAATVRLIFGEPV